MCKLSTTKELPTRQDLINHIEWLYEIAKNGEQIPPSVILCVFTKPNTDDIEWAKKEIKEIREKESSQLP